MAAACGFGVPTQEGTKQVKDKLYLQYEWYQVVGQYVQIRLKDRVVRTGVVDAATGDDRILWIAGHGAERRTLFERAEGYSVWIEYKWETLLRPG